MIDNNTREVFLNCHEQGFNTIDEMLKAYYLIGLHNIKLKLSKYKKEKKNNGKTSKR